MGVLKSLRRSLDARARRGRRQRALAGLRGAREAREVFASVDDDTWLWMHTEGRRQVDELRRALPDVPSDEIQRKWTGAAGDENLRAGFRLYAFFRDLGQRYLGRLGEGERALLDFGCGWGRITRFFLKDLPAERIVGVDRVEAVLEHARATLPGVRFAACGARPPMPLADASVDLAFANSVFSHLGEELQLAWLDELARCLRPGGVLVLTTWGRRYLEELPALRASGKVHAGGAAAFLETEEWLARYDRGELCHAPVGAAGLFEGGEYGETAIPRAYAEARWPAALELLEHRTDALLGLQDAFVVRRRQR